MKLNANICAVSFFFLKKSATIKDEEKKKRAKGQRSARTISDHFWPFFSSLPLFVTLFGRFLFDFALENGRRKDWLSEFQRVSSHFKSLKWEWKRRIIIIWREEEEERERETNDDEWRKRITSIKVRSLAVRLKRFEDDDDDDGGRPRCVRLRGKHRQQERHGIRVVETVRPCNEKYQDFEQELIPLSWSWSCANDRSTRDVSCLVTWYRPHFEDGLITVHRKSPKPANCASD